MARKSKRDDLAAPKVSRSQASAIDRSRQPRVVGWLVLMVGGCSSWYWYKPLPEVVNRTVHSTIPSPWPTTKTGPKSLWSSDGLVVPSIDATRVSISETDESTGDSGSEKTQLIGAPKVTLTPWNENRQDIRDVLKTERVPLVPLTPNVTQEGSLSNSPKVWTPDQQDSSRIGDARQTNSSWPDAGYVPPQKIQRDQQRASVRITTQIPPLLETGMKSIRTSDFDDSTLLNDTLKSQLSEPALTAPIESIRQPQFIRQPKRSAANSKD